jgi:hypothetical protein
MYLSLFCDKIESKIESKIIYTLFIKQSNGRTNSKLG